MRWTPKRTLPIVKPSLEHRYKQREIKTGRKPDGRQEREAAPHGAVSLLVLHNNEERLFAKIRSFRKGFLTGAADHLRIGDTGTARFGTTSRQKKTDRLVPVRNSVAATLSGDYSAASAGAGSVQGAAAQESHFNESGQSTHSAGTNSAAASAASSAAAGLFALPAHDTIAAAATTTINV